MVKRWLLGDIEVPPARRPRRADPSVSEAADAAAPTAADAAEAPADASAVQAIIVYERYERATRRQVAHAQARLLRAEQAWQYWFCEVEREQMQLAAHEAARARQQFLQAPDIVGSHGQVIDLLDPDPQIDRLHVKVWPIEPNRPRYICVLDAGYGDNIRLLKAKIHNHRHGISYHDMKVFFRGISLRDINVLGLLLIHDDCILHACVPEQETQAAKASVQFHDWRLLLRVE